MSEIMRRKPRPKPAPYARKPMQKPSKDTPATSAKQQNTSSRENLTLHDWLTVFAYIDEHPTTSQADVVQHFATKHTGALVFTQSTLSRKLKTRTNLEQRMHDNPSALSSKRPRIVTRPDVEKALVCWIRAMEDKREHFTGPMLREKRRRFEDLLDVPEEERLTGDGWVTSFTKTYNLREHRRHGEAGSVDLVAVEAEWHRIAKVLEKFAPRDRWNFDETSLFAFAPPDRGLSVKQMSGKKKDKFCLTLGFACNSDGSEKMPVFFIGRYKKPRVFKNNTPASYGFDYRNNKKAWMTAELFEDWVKAFDLKMRRQNRHVCLIIDNFSGHYIDFLPRNVQIEYFEPNLTSYVQPLDAGIIRCFKAQYRCAFSMRAVDLEEAGENDIYKINLLEAMIMAKDAWAAVKASTIEHCWAHAGIQSIYDPAALPAHMNPVAWDILREFASSDVMTLPDVESRLKLLLGAGYVDGDWRPAIDAILTTENNTTAATQEVERLAAAAANDSRLKICIQRPTQVIAPQITAIEKDLLAAVEELHKIKGVGENVPSVDELVEPKEERDARMEPDKFPGGDAEIVAHVKHLIAVEKGEIIEVDDSEDEDGENDLSAGLTLSDVVQMCEKLEAACWRFGYSDNLSLPHELHRFRGHLRQMEMKNAKQSTLDSYWRR